MNFTFSHRKISGLLTIVPANERTFVEEMANFDFPVARSMKLKQVMGYDKHRLVDGLVCASDLACFGMEHLFAQGLLDRDDIDALYVVTQSPDYLMPPTSSVVQGRLGLKHDMFCMDINQGCAGFVIGLLQAFLLLEQPGVRKVVLINVDVMSRKVSTKDRNSYPLIGDARVDCDYRAVGRCGAHPREPQDGRDASRCAGDSRGWLPVALSPETAVLHDDGEHNLRAQDHLRMDGTAVFNFVQVEVPPMIDALLASAGATVNDVDYFLFHQPNRFMLHKLADQMKVPYEKMPSNIVELYGNSSGVTIPMAIAHNLGEQLTGGTLRACLAGFGVGLTWASMLMKLGPLEFCRMVEFP